MNGCACWVSGSDLGNEVWRLSDEAGTCRKTLIPEFHSFNRRQETHCQQWKKREEMKIKKRSSTDEYHTNDFLYEQSHWQAKGLRNVLTFKKKYSEFEPGFKKNNPPK